MRTVIAAALALPLAAAGQPPGLVPPDPFEGTWLVEGVDHAAPLPIPKGKQAARSVVVVGENGDWYFWNDGEPFAVAKAERELLKVPARLTLRFKSVPTGPKAKGGATWKVLARADGDKLTLATDPTGRAFPDRFATAEGTPTVVYHLSRLKGEQPEHRGRGGVVADPGAAESPLAAMRGTWKLTASAGPLEPPTPADAGTRDVRLTLDHGRYTLKVGGGAVETGRVAVDPTQTPPTMVFVNTALPEGNVTWAVYEHTGGTLRVCKDAHAKGRPTALRAGPSAYVQTFERLE